MRIAVSRHMHILTMKDGVKAVFEYCAAYAAWNRNSNDIKNCIFLWKRFRTGLIMLFRHIAKKGHAVPAASFFASVWHDFLDKKAKEPRFQ